MFFFLREVNPDVVVDFGDDDAVPWPHVVASGADLFQFSIYFNEQPRGRRESSEKTTKYEGSCGREQHSRCGSLRCACQGC